MRHDSRARCQLCSRYVPSFRCCCNHHGSSGGADIAHRLVVLRSRCGTAFSLTHVGRAHVAAILVVAIGLLDLDLLPIDVELVRDDHGQRIPYALSGFRVLRHDCERVVGMHLDIGVGVDWRGRHRSRRASLSREEVGYDNSTTPDAMHTIAGNGLRIFPRLQHARVVRAWGALRILAPDEFPIYQTLPGHGGAMVATCHSGVSLAGAHALRFAKYLADGALPEHFTAFHSRRFDVPKASYGLVDPDDHA